MKRQLNRWLSDYREYHAVDYSLGELDERYEYIEIHKPSPKETDCRLTPAGRAFLCSFGLDEAAAALDAGED